MDSGFDNSVDSADLRANTPEQDWYESRNHNPNLLTLDTTTIDNNPTKKATIKNHGVGDVAYLTQELSQPQTDPLTLSFDIYIDRIEDNGDSDRSGLIYVGDDSISTNAPTGTSDERFVLMAFYDSSPGDSGDDLQLRARTSSAQLWDDTAEWMQVASGLSYDRWYTVEVEVDVAGGVYDVFLDGVLVGDGVPGYDGYSSGSVEYVSFAGDNYGRGDYHIDNVASHTTNVQPTSNPQLYEVYFNEDTVIGQNTLSLGYMLGYDGLEKWRTDNEFRTLSTNANFKLVRLFSHQIEPCSYWNESTLTGTYDWSILDDTIEKIYAVGAEPLICFGYVGTDTPMQVPNGMITDFDSLARPESYAAYVSDWLEHFNEKGYSINYYEILNEASHYFGWIADPVKLGNFLELYEATSNSMRAINPSVQIGTDTSILKRVLDGFVNSGLNLDFISFHKYDADGEMPSDSVLLERADTRYFVETTNVYGVNRAREIWYNTRGETLPVIMTEYNLNSLWNIGTDPRIQQVLGAVWTSKVIIACVENNVQFAQYFLYSKQVSYQQGMGQGFGMINGDNNEPWYTYYVQQLIGNNMQVGNNILESYTNSGDIKTLFWQNNEGKRNIILLHENTDEKMISLNDLEGQLEIYRIDNNVPWETPSIQHETAVASDNILLNGYTFLFIQINQ